MADFGILGNARGAVRQFITANGNRFLYGEGGELITVNGLPTEAQLASSGAGYYSAPNTGGVVATQTIPTTAACTTLFNNNGVGSGICYVVARAGAVVYTGSATQGPSAYSLLTRQDVVGQNTMVTTQNAIIMGTANQSYSGAGVVKQGVTLAAISAANNTAWLPMGNSQQWSATASLGSFYGLQVFAECYGAFIVRPQAVFSLAVLGGVAASNLSFTGFLKWYEIRFANG